MMDRDNNNYEKTNADNSNKDSSSDSSHKSQSTAPGNTAIHDANNNGKKTTKPWTLTVLFLVIITLAAFLYIFVFSSSSYQASVMIEVLPETPAVFSDPDNSAKIFEYDLYKNTQAIKMLSESVLRNTADNLVDENLKIFNRSELPLSYRIRQDLHFGKSDKIFAPGDSILQSIKYMISAGYISANVIPDSHYIQLSVTTPFQYDSEKIVEALRISYIECVVSTIDNVSTKISALRKEMEMLEGQIDRKESIIINETYNYGGDILRRHNYLLGMREQIDCDLALASGKMKELDRQLKSLENKQPSLPDDFEIDMQYKHSDFINNDKRYQKLNDALINAELDLLFLESAENTNVDAPGIAQAKSLIATLKKAKQNRVAELDAQFNEIVELKKKEIIQKEQNSSRIRLNDLTDNYNRHMLHISQLDNRKNNIDDEYGKIARLKVEIEPKEQELELLKHLYSELLMRINLLSIEGNRSDRIRADGPVSIKTVQPGILSCIFYYWVIPVLAVIVISVCCHISRLFKNNVNIISK